MRIKLMSISATIMLSLCISCSSHGVSQKPKTNYKLSDTTTAMISKDLKNHNSKYWFYIRESFGGFYSKEGVYYSQVLECDKKVGSPGYFSSDDAIGPFARRQDAESSRALEISIAQENGKKLYRWTVDCDSPF